MSVTTRVLPPEEWEKLDPTPLGPHWKLFDPNVVLIMVAELDGAIVGHWLLMPILHADSLWIDPAQRKQGGVWWALLDQMAAIVKAQKVELVWGAVEDGPMQKITEIMGGIPVPGKHYLVPFGRR